MSPCDPLLGVVTAFGRPEYDLLAEAATSLAPLQGLERDGRCGVQWVVTLDGPLSGDLNAARQVAAAARAAGLAVTVRDSGGARGPGPARNVALNVLATPWMLTVDGDDTVDVAGMTALLDAARTHGVHWAAGRCPHVTFTGEPLWDGPEDPFTPGPVEPGASFWEYKLATGNLPFLCTATVASTAAVQAVGGWPNLPRHRAEDTALWAVLTRHYRGVWVPTIAYYYRRHPASVTHQAGFRDLDEDQNGIAAMVAAGTTNTTSLERSTAGHTPMASVKSMQCMD